MGGPFHQSGHHTRSVSGRAHGVPPLRGSIRNSGSLADHSKPRWRRKRWHWLTVGYLVYIPLGPIAAAVTALFYQHLEAHMHKPYTGGTNILAWAHIILMNVGVVGATWLMMSAGYRGGTATLPTSSGGLGWTALQIHTNIMEGYQGYIAPFVAIAILGALAGGLGYVLAWRSTAIQ